jgi:glycolate oxidase
LPEAILKVVEIGRKYNIMTGNLLHAGDGNLHPLLLLDERDPDEVARARLAGHEIARACLALGGTLSGEHGIGLEKKDLLPELFGAEEIEIFRQVKAVFDPEGILNPGKIF